MNKLFKQGLVSLAAASVLASGAMADYDASVADYNTTKGNFAVLLNGQTAKADNVYVALDNNGTDEYNVTVGTKLFIQLPANVTFDTNPLVRATNDIFKDSTGAKTNAKEATVYTTADGKQRAYVEVDANQTDDNMTVVFEDINLAVASDYTNSVDEINATFGSVMDDGTVKKMSGTQPKIATVAKEFVKAPLAFIDTDGKPLDENRTLVTADTDIIIKNSGVVNAGDEKNVTLLFTVASGESAGDAIKLTFPSYVSFVANSVSSAHVLTDKKDVTNNLTDANATDVANSGAVLTLSGTGTSADNNNTLLIELDNATVEPTQVAVIISTKDINITSTQTTGTDIIVNVDGNATLVDGVSSFTFAQMREPNAVVTVVDGYDQNVTRGAANGIPMNMVQIEESFVDDINDSSFKITLKDGATFASTTVTDINNTGNGETGYVLDTNSHLSSDKTYLEVNGSGTNANDIDTIKFDFNITVPESFTGDAVYATIEKHNNNKIETKTVKVANVVNPAVTLDTNISDLKVGIGSHNIMRLDINETYYGSIQIKDNGDNRVYVKAVSCAEIEDDTNETNNNQGNPNGLNLQSGVSIDKSTFRYTINAESKGSPANTFVDLNITVPETCNVGDKVQLKLVHEDGTEWGPVTLATVGNAAIATPAEVNVTIYGDSAIQTLGTLNIKEQWAGALESGIFSIKAPDGVSFANAEIKPNEDNISKGEIGGLDNRVYTFNVAGSSNAEADVNITLSGYVSSSVTGPIEFEVVDYNATDADATDKDTGLVPTKVVLSYATANGTIPVPTLTASATTATPGSSVEFTCTGTGLGTLALTASNSDYTVDGMIVTVPETAVDGETVDVTCTETLGGKTATSEATTITVAAEAAEEATPADPKAEVESAVVAAGEMPIAGYYAAYDFDGDGTPGNSYNDWAYTTADGAYTFQLLGEPSGQGYGNTVFGWKQVTDVTVENKDFAMVKYGTGAFDWLVFTPDCSAVYKLVGATAEGKFNYDINNDGSVTTDDALNLTCTVTDGKVTFSAK